MTNDEKLKNLILHENAYFFKKDNIGFLSKAKVLQIFKAASEDKKSQNLLKVEPILEIFDNGREAKYSVIVFKYEKKAPFIDEPVDKWEEWKLAFLCIVDFEEYIVISRRNISNISEYLEDFQPLDYSVLTSIFLDENTTYEKFTMDNISIAPNAMRQKMLESTNLQDILSGLGLQTYTLSNARIRQGDQQVGLALKTSRINNLGEKKDIFSLFRWANNMVTLIENCQPTEGFLNSFAKPINFNDYSSSLTPNAILITLSKLYSDFEASKIRRCFIKYKDKEKNINLLRFLKGFEAYMEIVQDAGVYSIPHSSIDDLRVSKNLKSITLQSQKLSNIYIEYENNFTQRILASINSNNSFIVTFEDAEFIYTNRKLFKDSRLLGNIDALLQIFLPFTGLQTKSSEKGVFNAQSVEFSTDSIFEFTENEFLDNYDYFVCDDLSREWADFIGISDSEIAFFHAKSSDKIFSASAFQDVVGQALKNLGNLLPTDNQFSIKENIWNDNYNNHGYNTQIARIRTGQNSADLISYYKKIKSYPNIEKNIYLVINFISKSDLENNLIKLQNGEDFKERNEVIQILWFISSLIASCTDAGTHVFICCKP
ncbi:MULTISPECIES: hypothetical protein [unclassified Kaistella]|uniref:hypothetical protein n=1 Tax=unclassified Kaistella TaxID=2762626 RepID=UPI002735E326|nr:MULTISPECIES: hypothetical protein [unclassified Kaistella]MDP2453248.1 hypothetical protein [Kaistella sp. SH11-4b]MDP2456305.1 hypothetical protein [Kaistella sp. SH40-3]MDP2459061.1 hypothetical protein [Kaistella sp. SH19-2b]